MAPIRLPVYVVAALFPSYPTTHEHCSRTANLSVLPRSRLRQHVARAGVTPSDPGHPPDADRGHLSDACRGLPRGVRVLCGAACPLECHYRRRSTRYDPVQIGGARRLWVVDREGPVEWLQGQGRSQEQGEGWQKRFQPRGLWAEGHAEVSLIDFAKWDFPRSRWNN